MVVMGHQKETMLLPVDQNCHIYFLEVVDQNCHSTYTCDRVPNSEISEIGARLNANKIR